MPDNDVKRSIDQERNSILFRIESMLEMPVLILGFVWLILLIVELIWGLNEPLEIIVYLIWFIFIGDFLLRFLLAPRKIEYLKKNWLTLISLLIPALRVFRIFQILRVLRLARAVRGIRLLKVLTSLNRGMRNLQKKLKQRNVGYVAILTIIVIFVGAAGMYGFENKEPDSMGFRSYWNALWWTAMLLTTIGSEYWPKTAEGKILAFFLSVYAFTILGYLAAALASFFIGRDAESEKGEIAGNKKLNELLVEIKELKEKLTKE